MNKPSILMILPRKLFPLVSGYSLKNYNLLKILSTQYVVDLCLLTNEELSEEESEFYAKYLDNIRIFRISKAERIRGMIGAFFCGNPLQVGLYHSKTLKKYIEDIPDGKYQGCICELVRTMLYSENLTIPIMFDMVDSIGLNYQKSAHETSDILYKMYYKFESKRLLKFEKKCIEKADITFLFNKEEQRYWENVGNVCWLPHGVREELLHYEADYSREKNVVEHKIPSDYVAFIGKMNYRPNVDAVLWYVEHIHLKLAKRYPLVVIGAYPTNEIQQLGNKFPDIYVTGYMDDPYELLGEAKAVIAPMQTGGGIQNKVLEAMAMGKLNLVSSKAAEPISGAESGKEFLVCNDLNDYQQAYEALMRDPNYGKEIGENAKSFIQENFTWERYGKVYLEQMKLHLQKRPDEEA